MHLSSILRTERTGVGLGGKNQGSTRTKMALGRAGRSCIFLHCFDLTAFSNSEPQENFLELQHAWTSPSLGLQWKNLSVMRRHPSGGREALSLLAGAIWEWICSLTLQSMGAENIRILHQGKQSELSLQTDLSGPICSNQGQECFNTWTVSKDQNWEAKETARFLYPVSPQRGSNII